MSYPPPLYTGETGEVSATTRPDGCAPGAPREAYFEGLARMGEGEKLTDAEMDELMRKHDNIWVDEA